MLNLKIKKIIVPTFQILLVIMFLINSSTFLLKPIGTGDEILFISDLDLIMSKGWNFAIVKNISIPYMFLAYPFTFFFENYIALRIVNVLLLLFLGVYFYFRIQGPNKAFFNYFFFFLCTATYFFIGTNDALFFAGIIVFMTEIFFLQNEKKWNGTLAISAVIISFFTRELILIYLPVILFGCFVIYKEKAGNTIKFLYPGFLFLALIVVNIPSLKEKGKISYDDKSVNDTIHVTWPQRQYLAQLMVNNGELDNFNHPSWEQTEEYLKKNGENSLPKGMIDGLFLDVKLTTLEFFKDFYYSLVFGFRQIGLIVFITFFFPIRDFIRTKKINLNMYIPYAMIFIVSVLSLIIISFIEPRWYAPVFIMAIVYYFDLCKKKLIHENVILINYLILISMCLFNLSKTVCKIYC